MKRAIGWCLLAAVFAGLFTITALAHGWADAAIIWVLAAVTTWLIGLGIRWTDD